jgi:hypothetical protein
MGSMRLGVLAIKSLVIGNPDAEPSTKSSNIDEALEPSARAATLLREKLEKAQNELNGLKQENAGLVESLRGAQQETQDALLKLEEQATHFQAERNKFKSPSLDAPGSAQRTNAKIDDLMQKNRELREAALSFETRANDLMIERGDLNRQLKQMRSSSAGRPFNRVEGGQDTVLNGDKMSMDPFDNKVDQVSEASIKGGVDSLNDSMDTLVLTLLDEAEVLAKQHSHSSRPSAVQEHDGRPLLQALVAHSQNEEKRGFLLDTTLHDAVVRQLNTLFFSGEVICLAVDSENLHDSILRELSERGRCCSMH